MILEQLKNKKVLFFGKSRAFSQEELNTQLAFHNITLVKQVEDNIHFIIEGALMTPYEINESEKLYELKQFTFISLEIFETNLTKAIDEKTLLMSLKLSKSSLRIQNFLQNNLISDQLFLKILPLYNWNNEDFFDNNENRDITATLIRRFYKNIHTNHNVEYAPSGLTHLLTQTTNEELIKSIYFLPPLQKHLHIIELIASHPKTHIDIQTEILHSAHDQALIFLAQRENLHYNIQKELLKKNNLNISKALANNTSLDHKLIPLFHSSLIPFIAQNIVLTNKQFQLFLPKYKTHLAKNPSLTIQQQLELIQIPDQSTLKNLASNTMLHQEVIPQLLQNLQSIETEIYKNSALPQHYLIEAYKEEKHHKDLAKNINTPKNILIKLASSHISEVLISIAQNPSTPIETLYQLQLNAKLTKYVKENPTFSQHIQTQNIGWLL